MGAMSDSWHYKVVNGTGATVVCGRPCIYGGVRVVGAAGAYTMDVYDNASAASGQKVEAQFSVSAAVDKSIGVGMTMRNGITVDLSGNPTDDQIFVLYK